MKPKLCAGVLGGMGPAATIDFMQKVVAFTPASSDQEHVRMLIDHNPLVPNRQAAILRGGADPGVVLAQMGLRLQRAGADFLVMPCNSAHSFIGELLETVSIPFVSIIDATVDQLPVNAACVGILATDGCLHSKIYQTALQSSGFTPLVPDEHEINSLMAAISAVKAGNREVHTRKAMQEVAIALVAKGAEAIIAGCTEIPVLLDKGSVSVPLIESTTALAMKTVEIAYR